MNSPRIALVKQEVYQDLYVAPYTEKDAAGILFSSQGRVGPIGLMEELGADFFIVKEESAWETQIYRKVIPHLAPHLHLLKTQTLDKIPGQEFKQPGSTHANGEFAVNAHEINWGDYDIVISINVSLPTTLIKQYPHTLFAYMIGEANMVTPHVGFGYDVSLNQLARGKVNQTCGTVDFPYTFVDSDTLEKLIYRKAGRASLNKGVFMEINSTKERPVTKVPDHFIPLQDKGHEILLHKQNIYDNLLSIYDAKYFVKMGGRAIRGNSVAEAISLGTLVLMNREEVIHKELIIDECNVKTMKETIALIDRLEAEPAEYHRLLKKQREILSSLFFQLPLQSLINCLQDKRNRKQTKSYTLLNKLTDRLLFLKLK